MEISEKSKKNEIFEAYQELLGKVQEAKTVSHQEAKQKQHQEELVAKVTKFDVEHIVSTLGNVKVMVAQNLAELEKNLLTEYDRLSELQTAIGIESNHLDEIHQIKHNADSLEALLRAQKDRKTNFELDMECRTKELDQEINAKRAEWALEQQQHVRSLTEAEARLKKERSREEEEYRYQTLLERTKDTDVYEAKKRALEKNLIEQKQEFERTCSEREAVLAQTEQELLSLREQVAKFPQELTRSVQSAEKSLRESLDREYRHKMDLKAAEIDGERKLQQQTIASLQARIKEQDALIRDLSNKAEVSTQQVQQIALKALDSASGAIRNDREESKTSRGPA